MKFPNWILYIAIIVAFSCSKDYSETTMTEGKTNQNGEIVFKDNSSPGKQAIITIIDEENHQPIENFQVTYFDNPEFKIFRAFDPQGSYLPTIGIYPHNSTHILSTKPVKNGLVHIQTIESKEDVIALYKWEATNIEAR